MTDSDEKRCRELRRILAERDRSLPWEPEHEAAEMELRAIEADYRKS